MKNFWYTKELDTWFLETVDDVTFSLMEQWFWLVSTIDLQSKIKEKLWKDIEEYIILWACNQSFVEDILEIEYEIWLFFPCNVIVYRKNDKTFVTTIKPTELIWIIANDSIKEIAQKVERKLIMAIDNI